MLSKETAALMEENLRAAKEIGISKENRDNLEKLYEAKRELWSLKERDEAVMFKHDFLEANPLLGIAVYEIQLHKLYLYAKVQKTHQIGHP